VIPKRNAKDLIEVPEEVRNTLDIHLVDTIDEALALTVSGPESSGPAESA
jgi:ATP-dependent Lon protease